MSTIEAVALGFGLGFAACAFVTMRVVASVTLWGGGGRRDGDDS